MSLHPLEPFRGTDCEELALRPLAPSPNPPSNFGGLQAPHAHPLGYFSTFHRPLHVLWHTTEPTPNMVDCWFVVHFSLKVPEAFMAMKSDTYGGNRIAFPQIPHSSAYCTHNSPQFLLRGYVCPAHARRARHANECSGHLSQCFTPKHHSLLKPRNPKHKHIA